jgi:AraC family transcriptional regulator of adaptative response/methylated-DNA-[protein]-cysteine methyltransferase
MRDTWMARVEQACAILASAESPEPLAKLAARFGGSPFHFHRNFKRIVGITPREYADAFRLRKVKRQLRTGGSVTGAMLDAGYSSSSRFYEGAAPKLGMAPAAYRNGGKGARIRYGIVDSPLGRLLVAAPARGVCAVSMGASDAELERTLAREYPAAAVERDDDAIVEWTTRVLAHLEGREPRLQLPLDVRATAFQWQVWKALRAIPYGATRSYGEIARAIGSPNGARAVARACAANPVALAIPCHRVVPSAGGVGGYRWGAGRKKLLLKRETPRVK